MSCRFRSRARELFVGWWDNDQRKHGGRNIMLQEVERYVNRQAGGNLAQLSQLQLAQARLQVLSNLIQREVLFQRAEREKVLPTEAQIDGAIATQKQNSG